MTLFLKLSAACGIACAIVLLQSCTSIQTSSGAAYRQEAPSDSDLEVLAAADVEPDLQFPARIGLVRISRGVMTALPPVEAVAWMELAERMGPHFGEAVPINPLVVSIMGKRPEMDVPRYHYSHQSTEQLLHTIRLAAARQHCKHLLIYEVHGTAGDKLTPLSVAELTVVGAYIIPSRAQKSQGFAHALLVDVRNGYPYGQAAATAKRSQLSQAADYSDNKERLLQHAESAAAIQLQAAYAPSDAAVSLLPASVATEAGQ